MPGPTARKVGKKPNKSIKPNTYVCGKIWKSCWEGFPKSGKGLGVLSQCSVSPLADDAVGFSSSVMLKGSSRGRSKADFCIGCVWNYRNLKRSYCDILKSSTCCTSALTTDNCATYFASSVKLLFMAETGNGIMPFFLPVELTCSYEYLKEIWYSTSDCCILNLVRKSWLECSWKCMLAIMFRSLKHYWRPENENIQSLNRCACMQKEHLAGFTGNSEDSEPSSSLSCIETCWTFLLTQFQILLYLYIQHQLCHLQLFKLK